MTHYYKKNVVLIEGSKLSDDAMFILEAYKNKYSETRKSLLRRPDYLRWSYILDNVGDNVSILDVGVGAGQFVNMLALSKKTLTSISGLDLKPHTGFLQMFDNITMHYHSATGIKFPDGNFDVVTCLEVIEHLKTSDMNTAISELRRVTKKKLILTVPYSEAEPLPKHHVQSFNYARLAKLFPDAEFTFFSLKSSMAWVMIEENYTGKSNKKVKRSGSRLKNMRLKSSSFRKNKP